MDTIILSQDDTEIVFEVNDAMNVYSATLWILDKEIEGVLDNAGGKLKIQIADILKQIQLPMSLCHLKIEMTNTTIVHYNESMLSLVPTL